LPTSERSVPLPGYVATLAMDARARVVPALMAALKGKANAAVPAPVIARELAVALLPAIVFAVLMGLTWHALTKPDVVTDVTELEQMGSSAASGPAGATGET